MVVVLNSKISVLHASWLEKVGNLTIHASFLLIVAYTDKLEVDNLEDTSRVLALLNLGVKYAAISGIFLTQRQAFSFQVASVIGFFFLS